MDLIPLFKRAQQENASDVHLHSGSPARLRIDGDLYDVKNLRPEERELKEFAFSLIGKEQIDQFNRSSELDFACNIPEVGRVRGNLYREQGRLCAVFRMLPAQIPAADDIRLPPACRKFCELHKGLVLVTGPTGSGKSTTLAVMVNLINNARRCHIVTIEDPIEFVYTPQLATISQREVGLDTQDFQAALRHSFRQDPDVVLIGEMRDYETMKVAISLAETGHLTFSTLHTGEASQTINRIIDSFPPHQQNQVRMQLSISLEGIVSQILIKREGGRGRIAAHEVLICTRAVKNLIREGKIPQIYSAMQTGTEEGMTTMLNALMALYKEGLISYESALDAVFDKKEFAGKFG